MDLDTSILEENEVNQDDVCAVCDDENDIKQNYDAYTCNKCKLFFENLIKQDKWYALNCSNPEECNNYSANNLCNSCKFDKCLMSGMKVNLVKLDHSEHELSNKRKLDENSDLVDETSNLNVITLEKLPPIKTYKKCLANSKKLSEIPEKLGDQCNWCFRLIENLSEYNKKVHIDHCKFRLKDTCLYCSRQLSNLNEYNRKTHVEHCRQKKSKKNKKLDENERKKIDENQDIEDDCLIQPEKLENLKKDYQKCRGYKPCSDFQSESIYSNFPFQALDLDSENIKFVFENKVFHHVNCSKKDYQLQHDHRSGINRLCSDLSYHRYLQNILKRSNIMTNFSSIPHSYLTFNQLKKELNHYRDSIKKLKLDNLNYKRTIESLKSKEENFKRFMNLLSLKDYENLSQTISVCLNQKKGINGIIEKLLDCSDGVYHPRNKDLNNTFDEVECKICEEKISLVKMRDHISKHITKNDVEENSNRCGFCGLNNTCSIGIKTNQSKGNNIESAIWPESNCVYFKNFNIKSLTKCSSKNLINRPIECNLCKEVVWSLNYKSHLNEKHPGFDQSQEINLNSEENSLKSQDVLCKICNELWNLSKMRDHIAKHILNKNVEENSNRCGFCGLLNCEIEIKITSGKGKNATYGPFSACEYFRKFNLKSSTKPTKSSPSTNRPIECHLCKKVYWSYNMKCHFEEKHQQEEPPELITELEKEMILRT